MPAQLVRQAVRGGGERRDLNLALPPAFAASSSSSGRELVQGLGIILGKVHSEPRGPGDVPSHPVPAPDPKAPGVAESRDWARAFLTLVLSHALASGLTWLTVRGPPSSPGLWLSPAEVSLPPLYLSVR